MTWAGTVVANAVLILVSIVTVVLYPCGHPDHA